MRIILATLFSLVTSVLLSQIYLEPTIYPPTNGNTDGALKVELIGYSGAVDYEISCPTAFGLIPTVYTDSIGAIPYIAGVGHTLTARAVSQATGDTLAELLTSMSDHITEIDFINVLAPSTDLTCDGSVLASHTFNIGAASDYEYTMSIGSPMGGFMSAVPGWNNLCWSADYYFNINESGGSGTYYSGTISLEPLTPTQSNPSYTANVFSTVSDTINCTSVSYALVNGITPPYEYSWDGDPYSSVDTLPNACPGMHVLRIVDSSNDTLGMNFGVVDSTQFFQNPYLGSGPIIDTISFNTQNCSFDYNLPVDSSEITYFESIDNNTIYFEMDIWQSGSLVQVSDTVSCTYTQTGYNLFSLTLYCGTKATGGGKIFQIIDYVTPQMLSIDENEVLSNVKIYPNPSNGLVTIEMNEFKSVSILNALGKEVGMFKQPELNLSFLTSGIYFLSVRNTSGEVFVKQIILR